MIDLPRYSLDTPPPREGRTLSAHNFREVAPEVLSPLTWSVIGSGMERGFREIWSALRQPTLPATPMFTAYVAFRPYHVMSTVERLVERVPWMRADDPWTLMMGGPVQPTTSRRRGRVVERVGPAVHAVTELLRNGGLVRSLSSDVDAVERGMAPLVGSRRQPWVLGSLTDEAIEVARRAWAVHSRSAAAVVCAGGLLQRVLSRRYDEDTANAFIVALGQRQVSDRAHIELELSVLTGGRPVPTTYELACGTARFARWARADDRDTSATATASATAPATNGDRWLPTGTPLSETIGRVATLFQLCLGERERTKALAVRSLHVIRVALELGVVNLSIEDAAMLGVDELRSVDSDLQLAIAHARAEELDDAAGRNVPMNLLERGSLRSPLGSPDQSPNPERGVGLAPGVASGLIMTADGSSGTVLVGSSVDARFVLATRPAAVVSELGSVLSHLAIVCRECGIPLVSGVRLDVAPGTILVVDGSAGTVVVRA